MQFQIKYIRQFVPPFSIPHNTIPYNGFCSTCLLNMNSHGLPDSFQHSAFIIHLLLLLNCHHPLLPHLLPHFLKFQMN